MSALCDGASSEDGNSGVATLFQNATEPSTTTAAAAATTTATVSSYASSYASQRQFACLYTRHKTQKRKIWQDGKLVCKGSLAVLHQADPPPGSNDPVIDQCDLLQQQLQSIVRLEVTHIEMEKHLVTVEGPWSNSSTANTQLRQPLAPVKPSSSMQKILTKKFQVPAKKPPNPPAQSRQQSVLEKRKRPLQPGELQRQYYGAADGDLQQLDMNTQHRPPLFDEHHQQQQSQAHRRLPPSAQAFSNQQYQQQPHVPYASPPIASHPNHQQQHQQLMQPMVPAVVSDGRPTTATNTTWNQSPVNHNHNHNQLHQEQHPSFLHSSDGPSPFASTHMSSHPLQQVLPQQPSMPMPMPMATSTLSTNPHQQQPRQQTQPSSIFAANNGFDPKSFYGEEDDDDEEEEADYDNSNLYDQQQPNGLPSVFVTSTLAAPVQAFDSFPTSTHAATVLPAAALDTQTLNATTTSSSTAHPPTTMEDLDILQLFGAVPNTRTEDNVIADEFALPDHNDDDDDSSSDEEAQSR